MERFGGRKFVLTLLVILLATAVELFTERGMTEWFAGLLIGLVGVYGAANVSVSRKAIEAEIQGQEQDGAQAVPTPPSVDPVAIEELKAQVASQAETMQAIAENTRLTNQLLTAAAQGKFRG